MKTAFRLTVFLAFASGAALVLQLLGLLTSSISGLTLFTCGLCGSGILAMAIADYTPRRRGCIDRKLQRTIRREHAAPTRASESAAATLGYQTL